ncbi:homoserine kinase [Phycicoccus sp. Soil748]|uniref:homoserine kinase n=1 Tax=Phycicoccus sp. Soil748 TaxID=1736397 RepID=UPI0007031120|nr:homoserine kinase [Phycicoccus sp. Soil748]KRE55088.1 homoserine kinase [Phycicoccus sp. Soil748]
MAAALRAGAAVEVRVPASSANLGPGFDSVGLALGLWDTCVATVTEAPGLLIEVEGQGAGEVPLDATHLVHRSMLRAWDELGVAAPLGLSLRCRNEVPHGRGLGSSATAIVTGIVAAQALHDVSRGCEGDVDLAFTNTLAARMEGHPDNSSASVFGGLTLSWSDGGDDPTHTLQLDLHPDVRVLVLVPAKQLSTAKARSVLPTHVRHGDAALNSARAALLVQALTAHPEHLLAGTREWLHQEARRESFGGSMEVVDRLRAAGHAAVISGAGPSVLVLSTVGPVDGVEALVDDAWDVLSPGVPSTGAQVRRLRP